MNKRERYNNVMGYLFISPWLIGFFIFTLFPIIASFILAFTRYDVLSPPRWIGIDNWFRLLEDTRYHNSLKATFYYVFTAVPLRLIFALLVAMLLKPSTRLAGLYRGIYYLPSLIGGSVAVAVVWRQVFGSEGLINFILGMMGIKGLNWLGNPSTAIWTLIILAVWQFGSPMLIFLAGLKQIPDSLYEAASIDGAKGWDQFIKITLPMLSPVILFNLIMQIINGFMVFTQAYIITSGGPLDTTLFYSLYLYQKAFQSFEMGYASAMAWVLLMIIAFFTALAFKSSRFWVYYESEEGK
ncbi:MAG TPA: sugar ABC transporter permease [bacterium]|jgi:multiple sugar transport system permease protein|nr:sugar ABC transporter permease [bacterium]HON71822.1 sugar ABC transporter permease [bacterium]HRR91835.1 sugar ABC transporter permease [bacterium]